MAIRTLFNYVENVLTTKLVNRTEGKPDESGNVVINEEVLGEGSFDFDALPDEMKRECALYGFKQKLADGSNKAENKIDGMKDVFERLLKGEWKTARAVSAKAPRKRKVDAGVAQALADLRGIDLGVAIAKLETLTAAQMKEVSTHPAIVERAAELKAAAEEEAASVDISSLF